MNLQGMCAVILKSNEELLRAEITSTSKEKVRHFLQESAVESYALRWDSKAADIVQSINGHPTQYAIGHHTEYVPVQMYISTERCRLRLRSGPFCPTARFNHL